METAAELPCETDSKSSSSSSSSGFVVAESPCVGLKIVTRRGTVNRIALVRNVYRIGSQEDLADLRLKSRYVRPLHAVLIVERKRVFLVPFEGATVMMVDSVRPLKKMTQVTSMVSLEVGQTFEIEGITIQLEKMGDEEMSEKVKEEDGVYLPEKTVPIADSHIRYLEPPMGLRSPARKKPHALGVRAKFVSQTSINSLHDSAHSEKEEDDDPNFDTHIRSQDQRSSPVKKAPKPRRISAAAAQSVPDGGSDEEIRPLDSSKSSSSSALLSSQQPARRRPRLF